MVLPMGLSVQCIMDLVVAGISLVIGLGFFAFIASILCSAVFIYNVKHALSGTATGFGSLVFLPWRTCIVSKIFLYNSRV
ncbi:hypothetical protein NC651_007526 [Populus alba x Populus x berolinensis]|nr:hypothetical protein NC651_007526 [Populus alba x Populus x berolinensis]